MGAKHQIDVFTEGFPSCQGAVGYADEPAASAHGCNVRVWNVNEAEGLARRNELGIGGAPAIAIDDEPLSCCRAAEHGIGA
jgi:hypothetical protein